MSLCAIIDALIASGCSPEQIGAAARAHEAEEQRKRELTLAAENAKREMRRANAADRQARKRDRDALARESVTQNDAMSHDVTRDAPLHAVTERDNAPVGAHPPAAFISPSEVVPPSDPKGSSAPRKSGGSNRGFRLPDDFEPDATTIAVGERLGHSRPHIVGDGLAEFGDYWRGTPGAKGLRTDWQGTYRNRLRATAPRSNARAGPPRSGSGRTVAEMAAMNLDGNHDERFGTHDSPAQGAGELDQGRSGFVGRLPLEAAADARRGTLVDH